MKTIFIFCACVMLAVSTSTSAEINDSVKTVKIDPNVPLPEDVIFQNPDAGWVQYMSGLGALIADVTMDEEDLKNAMTRAGIHMDKLVHEKFTAELSKSKLFSKVGDPSSQGTFHLRIVDYGLDRAPFTTNILPVLKVEARLLDRNEDLIWEETCGVNNLDANIPDGGLDDFLKNDAHLRKAFTHVTELVSIELVQNLQNPESTPHRKSNSSPSTASGSSPKPGNSTSKKGM